MEKEQRELRNLRELLKYRTKYYDILENSPSNSKNNSFYRPASWKIKNEIVELSNIHIHTLLAKTNSCYTFLYQSTDIAVVEQNIKCRYIFH